MANGSKFKHVQYAIAKIEKNDKGGNIKDFIRKSTFFFKNSLSLKDAQDHNN